MISMEIVASSRRYLLNHEQCREVQARAREIAGGASAGDERKPPFFLHPQLSFTWLLYLMYLVQESDSRGSTGFEIGILLLFICCH